MATSREPHSPKRGCKSVSPLVRYQTNPALRVPTAGTQTNQRKRKEGQYHHIHHIFWKGATTFREKVILTS